MPGRTQTRVGADEDVAFAGAARQAEMVRAGEVSPTELVRLSLNRIERLDPELNAFRKVSPRRRCSKQIRPKVG